jgi:hypothetical protein
VAVTGVAWGLVLKFRRPHTYAAIGLGPYAATSHLTTNTKGTLS